MFSFVVEGLFTVKVTVLMTIAMMAIMVTVTRRSFCLLFISWCYLFGVIKHY